MSFTKSTFHLLAGELRKTLSSSPTWSARLAPENWPFAVHLAVFQEPYLTYLLEGKKTVESRFSINKCAPYERVSDGDLVLLKRTGGPIVGVCVISVAWFYELDRNSWSEIRKDYATAICAQDPEFWASRKNACYASLMKVTDVAAISPMKFEKRDRRGWVILKSDEQLLPLSSP